MYVSYEKAQSHIRNSPPVHFLTGPKGMKWGEQEAGKMHNEELNNLFSSPNIIKMTTSR
jgi:hypothetical protein